MKKTNLILIVLTLFSLNAFATNENGRETGDGDGGMLWACPANKIVNSNELIEEGFSQDQVFAMLIARGCSSLEAGTDL